MDADLVATGIDEISKLSPPVIYAVVLFVCLLVGLAAIVLSYAVEMMHNGLTGFGTRLMGAKQTLCRHHQSRSRRQS